MKEKLLALGGAFADGAVLFPLLAVLSFKGGFSATTLLWTAGVAYLGAGFYFRVPMSVQPLKSIAIAAIAMGASFAEIRLSGAILGGLCLALTVLDVDRLGKQVPESLIHGLQSGLGVILIGQGLKFGFGLGVWSLQGLGVSTLVLVMLILPRFLDFPLLGLLAAAGVGWGVVAGFFHPPLLSGAVSQVEGSPLRAAVVAGLVFPQLALTLGNSVLGTADVARRYFGARASRVTIRGLLYSIGLGNIISAAVGGLPFCHGAGGVTAHVRGGAKNWSSNAIIGVTLLGLAVFQWLGGQLHLGFPVVLLSALLISIGVFHLGLALPTWSQASGKAELLAMALTAGLTQNMLGVLVTGMLFEVLLKVQYSKPARVLR